MYITHVTKRHGLPNWAAAAVPSIGHVSTNHNTTGTIKSCI